jgi:outer membrane lipoprotein-sorting protein
VKKKIVRIVLLSSLVLNTTFAQKPSEALNADTILARVVKGFAEVHDFVATIDAEVKMDRVQVPKMHATMDFKRPDKVHFTSQGFLFVPRDGVTMNPAVLSQRYDASFIGTDTIEGLKLFKLQLAAKAKKTKLRQMYAWIDPVHWTIAKIETIPYEGRTLSTVFDYEFLQEKFWLPSKMIVTFGSTMEGEKVANDSISQPSEQFDQMQRGVPRNGSVTILYSNYKVNAGIDDSVFEEKKK